jgi:superfamily II DNA or RNA helicase
MGQRDDAETISLPFPEPEKKPAGDSQVPTEKLAGHLVPQADNPDRIVHLLELLRDGIPVNSTSLGVDERQVDYYFQAAQILGLVSKSRQLFAAGRALLSLEGAARNARLALAFADSECGRAWARCAKATSLIEVPRDTAESFIDQAVNLGGETIGRRASTLKTWFGAWMPYHPDRLREEGTAPVRKRLALEHTAVLGSGRSIAVVQALGPGTALLRCATGYLSINGYKELIDPLVEARLQLLVGYEVTFQSVKNILESFRQSIDEGPPTRVKERAVRELHRSVITGRVKVRNFDPRFKPRLHAKLYLFDEGAAYVTSSNLSENGLRHNIEIGYVVREPEPIRFYREQFDELFREAKVLTYSIIRAMEESWVFAPLTQPYLLYLRVLLALFPSVPDLAAKTRRQLAAYQELIVNAALHSLRESRGCLMVSPTGTGKTVMACYVAAALFHERRVERIFVLCPNPRLQKAWKEEISRFGIGAEVITHAIIQGKGNPLEGLEARLRRMLPEMRGTDLVMIDECHAFRNEETNGFETLSRVIGERSDLNRPQLLLLTATPMSKDETDLNALLRLIDEPPLETIHDLVNARRVVNVSLPFIIKRFGTDGQNGSGPGLAFGDKLHYFGRIQVRTARYTPEDSLFECISKTDFRVRRISGPPERERGGAVDAEERDAGLWPATLIKLNLMRRAESSPLALERSIDQLLSANEKWFVPEDPVKFRESLLSLRGLATSPRSDTKLAELVRLLKEKLRGRRVLVFSFWTATVEYLKKALTAELEPGVKVEQLTGALSPDERGGIIRRFAPTAQGRSRRPRRDDIHILVTTDAIAEGENLQDADAVINYDLPWTPLMLIQRVGRVDRPTKVVRDIEVWNFFPGSDLFETQLGLEDKLKWRSELYDRMARTKVFGEHHRDLARHDEHDVGFVRAFYEKEGNFQDLREKVIPTSAYLVDRANASAADMARAAELPVGVRSCMQGPRAGIFALIKAGAGLRCVFWQGDGSPPVQSLGHPSHEPMLQYIRAERDTPLAKEPPDFQNELERLVKKWAMDEHLEEDSVTVSCAAVIVAAPENAPST